MYAVSSSPRLTIIVLCIRGSVREGGSSGFVFRMYERTLTSAYLICFSDGDYLLPLSQLNGLCLSVCVCVCPLPILIFLGSSNFARGSQMQDVPLIWYFEIIIYFSIRRTASRRLACFRRMSCSNDISTISCVLMVIGKRKNCYSAEFWRMSIVKSGS